MRKALMVVVAGLVLAGCNSKSVEVATTTTASQVGCNREYLDVRQVLRADISQFQVRLNNLAPDAVSFAAARPQLVAEFDVIKSDATTRLDQIALRCGATGACASQLAAWTEYEKNFLRDIALVIAGASSNSPSLTEPAVDCS